jgi:hypothetical protein
VHEATGAQLSAGTQMGGQFGQKSKDAVIAIDGALIASGRPLVEAVRRRSCPVSRS